MAIAFVAILVLLEEIPKPERKVGLSEPLRALRHRGLLITGLVALRSTEPSRRPVERPIASSAYSFVRFAGGAVAPWLAGKLAEWVAPDAPFFVGAAAVVVALVVLIAGRRYFTDRVEVVAGHVSERPSASVAVATA